MPDLKIASYLAPNLLWFYKAVGAYLERSLGLAAQVEQSLFDPLDDPLLQKDQIDAAFICGLPFVRHNSTAPAMLQALVAPVMRGDRYGNRPVYFADVIVHADSPLMAFEQLAGTTFCYNDLGSNSGYNLMRDRLMQGGYSANFFAGATQSGSHQQSIQWVANHVVDCAAIDSTVLEQALRDSPDLAQHLRIVESIGPCPMPPIVGAMRLGETLHQIQSALLHPDTELQQQMQQASVLRFAAVDSSDYEPIAQIYYKTQQAGYAVIH
ncbi:PhnD/SsuA/transferrin family substrate-binding protein [Phormidium tenue FACHB-886]|nr:PhnD/SsuA/transferrin family substrate-binding protein [Phormidium tenue FACHB-886]